MRRLTEPDAFGVWGWIVLSALPTGLLAFFVLFPDFARDRVGGELRSYGFTSLLILLCLYKAYVNQRSRSHRSP